jgi:hypothetical protein
VAAAAALRQPGKRMRFKSLNRLTLTTENAHPQIYGECGQLDRLLCHSPKLFECDPTSP